LKSFAIFQAPNEENWICSTGFSVFTPKPNQDRDFYFYQILGEIGEKQFFSFVAGTNYPAVNDRDMRKILILEAPYPEQIEIGKKLVQVSDLIVRKKMKIKILDTLRKSLTQNLLTGKIRIQMD
jgi:type I restriction enzyme S subunit